MKFSLGVIVLHAVPFHLITLLQQEIHNDCMSITFQIQVKNAFNILFLYNIF